MLKPVLRVNKTNFVIIISLLVCALFLSFYCVNYSVEVYKKAGEGRLINQDTYYRNSANANKFRFNGYKLTDTYKEEVTSGKSSADSHKDSSEKKWLLSFAALISMTLISVSILYIKGWFIKVTHSRFQFFKVHFTQLKDGKKDALSYIYSM